MTLSLPVVAAAIGYREPVPPVIVSRWSTDTRTLEAGALYFALPGPNFDGADFVAEAFAKGAIAAVAARPIGGVGPVLVSPDPLRALQDTARYGLTFWNGTIVGITGSAGKTTTKECTAALLSAVMRTGKSGGNLNNHIGVPLSVLRLPDDAKAGVIEMAMNHAGEIRRLAEIAPPVIGVVTNVGHAHVENFEDGIEGVARAKRELIESLPAGGIAVLNSDDARVAAFAAIHPGRTITFGLSDGAKVRAEDVECTETGSRFRLRRTVFETSLPGRHGVLSVLAGLAVAEALDINPERLAEAARHLTPEKMRGQRWTHRGILIWDDCYNSNPEAACLMVDLLRRTKARRHIAVLGEMLELGRWAEDLHRRVGRHAAECGVSVLVGIRGAARYLVDEAVRAGLDASAAHFFPEPAEAGEWLKSLATEGDAILFKGSRGTRVELALERFLA